MSKRKGFTLVEVMLFLAITALLFIGIAMGVQNSVFQQQYNDSTQSFLEFMRSVYSKVSNPQTTGHGNSEEAIYGKLVVFGESVMLDGTTPNDSGAIFTYDVIGKASTVAGGLSTGSATSMLATLDANVVRFNRGGFENSITSAELASPEKYTPHWGAVIDGTTNGAPFKGSILVVRHPRSGTINTLVLNEAIEDNRVIEANLVVYEANSTVSYNGAENLLKNKLGNFRASEVDFCVNPSGPGATSNVPRQNIRIIENARNASDVEFIELDGSDNRCAP